MKNQLFLFNMADSTHQMNYMTMKKASLYLLIPGLVLISCVEETFVDNDEFEISPQAPSDLAYSPLINAREFAVLSSAPPTYNAYGAVPTFEIVEVRDADGTALDGNVIDTHFSIANPTTDIIIVSDEDAYITTAGDTITRYPVVNSANIGQITIATNNPLSEGNYFFDISMRTQFGEQVFETTFESVFELYMGPALASDLIYSPTGQNLLAGSTALTTEPLVFGANPAFTFQLGSDQDKLTIDESTGVLGLVQTYVPASEPEIISPTINLISSISGEVTSFDNAVQIYISKDPVVVPKDTIIVFYPTFEAENLLFGYRIHVVEQGDPKMIWTRKKPSAITSEDRPEENINQKRLTIKLVKPNPSAQVPHESWCILNSQDLSAYQIGFDVEAKFYTKNQFVEYLSTDGTTPSLMRLYVSTDYSGDFDKANWTDITDELVSNIAVGGVFVEGNEFHGFPYPGDQLLYGFPDPEGLKDPAKNSDDVFTQSVLDLSDYLGMNNVTFAFRVYTTFTGTISRSENGDSNNSGQFWLEDFHITAFEQ